MKAMVGDLDGDLPAWCDLDGSAVKVSEIRAGETLACVRTPRHLSGENVVAGRGFRYPNIPRVFAVQEGLPEAFRVPPCDHYGPQDAKHLPPGFGIFLFYEPRKGNP